MLAVTCLLAVSLFSAGCDDFPETAPDPDEQAAPKPADDLAAWRSPVAGPVLTDGEYRILYPTLRRRIPAARGGSAELVVVPFETPSGAEGRSIAVLQRTPAGYRSHLLYNLYAAELAAVRVVQLGPGRTPEIVTAEQAGSGGFLTLRVFSGRAGRERPLWSLSGIYEGEYRLLSGGSARPTRMRVVRRIRSRTTAHPRGAWRETYVWRGRRFVLSGRERIRSRRVAYRPAKSWRMSASARE